MQLLPFAQNIFENAQSAVQAVAHNISEVSNNFSTVYASSIEAGKEIYTGVPEGFTALESNQSFFGSSQMEFFKKALQDREAFPESLQSLQELLTQDKHLSVSKTFSVLTGCRRSSEVLSDTEAKDFTLLMHKLGFSKEEAEDLIALSDTGKGRDVWKAIQARISDLKEEVQILPQEFSALLRSLDLSTDVQTAIEKNVTALNLESFTGERLQNLFIQADHELERKSLAAKHAQDIMRPAMTQALEAAGLQKLSDPSSDIRRSSRSAATEQKVQVHLERQATDSNLHSALQKSTLRDTTGEPEQEKDSRLPFTARETQKVSQVKQEQSPLIHEEGAKRPSPSADVQTGKETLLGQSITAFQQPGMPGEGTQVARQQQQAILSQVEQAIFQQASTGAKQFTFSLTPENLGHITVMLTMQQGELRAFIRAENQDTAAVLQEQMAELKAKLEENGIKVADIGIGTKLAEDSSSRQWGNNQEHNFMQDSQEKNRSARIATVAPRGGGKPGHESKNTAPSPRARSAYRRIRI